MTDQQISSALNQLFEQVDGVQRKRQLVFWYDPKAEFREVIDSLPLSDEVETIVLDDTPFTVKHRVFIEQPETSFLLYAPFAEPAARENWLLDVQLQASPFSADRAEILWQQFGFHDRALIPHLREHITFFNSKQRREAFTLLDVPAEASEDDLTLAMMCALLGLKVADGNMLIRTVLLKGLNTDDNKAFGELTKFITEEAFWQLCERQLNVTAERPSLRELFIQLAVTHLAHDLDAALNDALTPKRIQPSTKAYVFVDNWLRSADASVWREYSQALEQDLGISSFAETLEPDAYRRVQTFKVFDELLIRQLAAQLRQGEQLEVRTLTRERKALYYQETSSV